MRAVVVDRWLEPTDLAVREAPEPGSARCALVDVRAAGCNFFDILLCQGKYQVKPPFPFTPGAEVAGVVRALGAGVSGFAAGDRVFGSSASAPSRSAPLVPAAARGACPTR